MAQILDGKALAETIRKEIAVTTEQYFASHHRRPTLAAVLVGDDPASHVYVRNKIKACEQVGIGSESHYLSASTTEQELLDLLQKLNSFESVDGILLQLASLELWIARSRTRLVSCLHSFGSVGGFEAI